MAQPLPSPPPNWPLQALLKDIGVTEKELRSTLRDGAAEAERLIPKLIEQQTTGGTLKAAQSAIILREIRALMSALWGDIGPVVKKGVTRTVMTAAEGEDILFKFLGTKATQLMKAALREQAKAGVEAVLAKSYNGIPLSTQVYRTQALSSGLVHKRVSNGLILGHSAQRIAKDVRDLISPDVAGGVSYAAMRLARTEINNAYKTSQEWRYKDEPWTKGMRWNLSRSHPVPDICDEYAAHGVYPFGERPLGHPNCLCYLTPEQLDEDAFVDAFVAGEYDDYLEDVGGLTQGEIIEAKPAPKVNPTTKTPYVPGRDITDRIAEMTRDGNAENALNSPGELSDPCDRSLAAIGEQQGFDGLPSPGSVADEVAAGGVELWRGVIPFKGKAAGLSDEQGEDPAKAKSAEELVEQFRSGTYEPGCGIYGNGFYFSVSRRVAEHFATQKKKRISDPDLPKGKVFRVALRPGAKVVDYDDLMKQISKWRKEATPKIFWDTFSTNFVAPPGTYNPNFIDVVAGDPGRFAAMLGYDAIHVRGKQDGAPYIKGEPVGKNSMGQKFSAHDQYVILNRTAVVMEAQ